MSQPREGVNYSIEARGLKKSFGDRLVLAGVDLKIKRGESVVLFGRNGAGKTTLINLLATIMKPSSGEIFIDGLNQKKDSEEIRRRIGVVTHQTFLYKDLTAYENLEFYARMYDIPSAKGRIYEVADMVGMRSYIKERVGTLSHGMQRRLSLARALLHKPNILLLDEPETGLDQHSFLMLKEILQAEAKQKHTVLLTTHVFERWIEFGDRLLILEGGRIRLDSLKENLDLVSLRELYHRIIVGDEVL